MHRPWRFCPVQGPGHGFLSLKQTVLSENCQPFVPVSNGHQHWLLFGRLQPVSHNCRKFLPYFSGHIGIRFRSENQLMRLIEPEHQRTLRHTVDFQSIDLRFPSHSLLDFILISPFFDRTTVFHSQRRIHIHTQGETRAVRLICEAIRNFRVDCQD